MMVHGMMNEAHEPHELWLARRWRYSAAFLLWKEQGSGGDVYVYFYVVKEFLA